MSTKRQILTGSVAGKFLKAVVTAEGLDIGRSHERGLLVEDPEASRLHCVVRVSGDTVTVEDKSQNGTSVNGRRIASVTVIKPGDVIRIGMTDLTLGEEDAPAEASAPAPAPAPKAAASEPGDPTVLKPGDMIDRYRIARLIGKGGMGTVYEAVHTGLDLPRALKVLTLPNDPAYAAFRAKFLDEGKILARLRHENITQVHDAAYDEKTQSLFFAMDLVLYDDGKPCTLADVAYDECDVSVWFASLASALDYIHAQGIVHSDIKLQNVLVSSGQKVKLADFGVAHLLSGRMRSTLRGEGDSGAADTVGFTAHYVAPEVLEPGGMPSVASDVYAFGVLLVRLLANAWYDEKPTVLAEIAAKRSLNWRPVLAQMLCADPKRRPTNLMKLVMQLRHGSKALVRRKYQDENRRRRSQKVRLQRAINIKTDRLMPTALAPEPKRGKYILCAVLALVGLAGAIGVVSVSNSRKAEEEQQRARLEAVDAARGSALMAVRKAREALNDRVSQFKGELVRHQRDYSFVSELSQANVAGIADRETVILRNGCIEKYGEVLKSVGAVRAALADFRQTCTDFENRLDAVRSVDSAEMARDEFAQAQQTKQTAFEAACEAERRKWSAYEAAKEQIAKVSASRTRMRDARRRSVEAIRQMLAAEADLKTVPERAVAKAKIAEGDAFATAVPVDPDSVVRSYADAVACLSNGIARLRAERAERIAIEEDFKRSDDRLRNELLPEFRGGKLSLAEMEQTVQDLDDAFSGKWNAGSTHPTNRELVAEHAFCLQAPAAYFKYLVKALPGQRDENIFAPAANGVKVRTKKFSYQLGWHDIFSTKKLDTRAQNGFRRTILDVVDVPMKIKVNARGLLGRWIVLKGLMPTLNTKEQEDRLVEAVQKDGGAAALSCARRELPERFSVQAPSAEVATEGVPQAASVSDGTNEVETAETDASQERVIVFVPSQGLVLPVAGADKIELTKCLRTKRANTYWFEVFDGEARAGSSGVWRTATECTEGLPFDVRSSTAPGICRFWPLAWIDNALGNGQPLLFIRCQYLSEEPNGE